MTRHIAISLIAFSLILLIPLQSRAGDLDFMDGLAIGAGINQGTKNEADESFALGLKARQGRWQYGVDFCMSEDRGGIGKDNFVFVWGGWLQEFDRPDWQDYGIYVGGGVGFFLLESNLIDWPAGPFAIVGWDFSSQAGLEGKVGYFGKNYWGTAMLYWYFN
ncbi:MAG TPA: hypothetical protein ENN67_07125 [Firmicutes bacterium]|nr:hypothetical protein [Bacillota bacterium]